MKHGIDGLPAAKTEKRPDRNRERRTYRLLWPVLGILFVFAFTAGICIGSISFPAGDTFRALLFAAGWDVPVDSAAFDIILNVRMPRVLTVTLTGAALALCGTAMQGLLRNPMADGSTLGVSSGASLGAVLAIAFGIRLPFIGYGGIMVNAMIFAFASLLLILFVSSRVDPSLSTHTIILVGIIFSMFANALISVAVTFAGSRANTITFWTLGSLAGASFKDAAVLAGAMLLFGTPLFCHAQELNAFAVGEENALHIGVNVKKTKLMIMVCVSALTGVCVSIGGTIGFAGLVTPHIVRYFTGPNHKRLLPAAAFSGAILLLTADLLSRTLLRPRELPIGVVTSIFGAVVFMFVLYRNSRHHV